MRSARPTRIAPEDTQDQEKDIKPKRSEKRDPQDTENASDSECRVKPQGAQGTTNPSKIHDTKDSPHLSPPKGKDSEQAQIKTSEGTGTGGNSTRTEGSIGS